MAQSANAGEGTVRVTDLMEVRTPIDIDASPDGSLLSVVAQRRRDRVIPRLEREGDQRPFFEFTGDVHIIDVATGEVLFRWPWPKKAWSARWSPDGASLVVVAETSGGPGLWVSDMEGVKPRCLIPSVQSPLVDGVAGWTERGVVVLADTPDGDSGTAGEIGIMPRVDYLVHHPDQGENTGDGLADPTRDLLEIDLESGTIRMLAPAIQVTHGIVSPDRRWVACVGTPSRTEMSSFSTVRHVEIRSLEDGALVSRIDGLTSHSFMFADPAWAPDSSAIALVKDGALTLLTVEGPPRVFHSAVAFRSAPRNGTQPLGDPLWSGDASAILLRDDADDVWTVNVTDGAATRVALPAGTADPLVLRGSASCFLGPDASRCLAVLPNPVSLDRQLWLLPLDGAEPWLLDVPPWQLPPLAMSTVRTSVAVAAADGDIAFYSSDETSHPPEVYALTAEGHARRVTGLNAAIADQGLPSRTTIRWKGEGGAEHLGMLALPAGYAIGDGPIPVVVDAYPAGNLWAGGSDRWEYLQVLPPQLLTAQGWAVLMVGATPTKDAENRAHLLTPVLGGLDRLVELGIADERVALVGVSGGGYLANCAITVTSRFRGAISFNGISNLASHFGQLYVGPDGPLMHGTANAEAMGWGPPWVSPGRYIEMSPVFHLDKVRTPLLLVHGTGDTVAAAAGADEMFVGLRRLGKEAAILRFHGEGHGPSSFTEPNRTEMFERVLDFLSEHLR